MIRILMRILEAAGHYRWIWLTLWMGGLVGTVPAGYGQDAEPAGLLRLLLSDGTSVVGNIEEEDRYSVWIRTPAGERIRVPTSLVLRRERAHRPPELYDARDPDRSRLLFGPSGRTMVQGQATVSLYEFLYPHVNVGVWPGTQLGGGLILVPFTGAPILQAGGQTLLVRTGDLLFSAGGLYFRPLSNGKGLALLYGIGLYELERAAATFGLGWRFTGGLGNSEPIILLGGEFELTPRLDVLTENWIPTSSDVSLLGLGLRMHIQRVSLDVGGLFPTGRGLSRQVPVIPWFGISVTLGPSGF